jgi:glutathione S-transferase
VIVEYLDTLSPVGKADSLAVGANAPRVKTWEALADGMLDAAVAGPLEATWGGRTKAQRSQAWINRQMDKINASLKAMAKGLGEKPFCGGIHLSLADVAVGCALGYLDFRFAQIDWRTEHPNLPNCRTS